jgi:hypothetical protein
MSTRTILFIGCSVLVGVATIPYGIKAKSSRKAPELSVAAAPRLPAPELPATVAPKLPTATDERPRVTESTFAIDGNTVHARYEPSNPMDVPTGSVIYPGDTAEPQKASAASDNEELDPRKYGFETVAAMESFVRAKAKLGEDKEVSFRSEKVDGRDGLAIWVSPTEPTPETAKAGVE